MKEISWTEDDIKEFDKLVDMVSSRNQIHRIDGRLKMRQFVANHGQEKCDAMFSYLESRSDDND